MQHFVMNLLVNCCTHDWLTHYTPLYARYLYSRDALGQARRETIGYLVYNTHPSSVILNIGLGAVYKGRPANGEWGWFRNFGHSWTGGGGGWFVKVRTSENF